MVGVVILPEKALKKLNEYILPQWKLCFFAAVAVGLLSHLYKITGWIPNWDSLVFRYDAQNMVGLGRWFLPVACSFSSFYDLPFLNGIVAIAFHALGAVCICRILNVRKKITAFLIGGVIASFPTVTSVMMYNYVADGYSIAFFLSVLAALYMIKGKKGYIIASVLIALSVGIYQAYITVTIMLVLLRLIDEIIYNKAAFQDILKKSIFMLLSGVFGMVLYALILKAVMSIFSLELLDYQGINETASLSGLDLAGSLYTIKQTFIKFFFDFTPGISVYVVLNIFAFLFTLAHYIKYIMKNKIYRKPVNACAILILAAMLLAGAGALAFVNPAVDYHNLMLMGYSIFYIFFLILYERGTDANERHTCIKRWAILTVATVIIANQVVISNVSYHKAQMAYEKSYGVLMRMADRIEQTPDAENCDKILVIGSLKNSKNYSVNLPPDITGITDGYILRADDETVGQSVLCSALCDYCGMDYKFLAGEEKRRLIQSEKVEAMGEWPAQDSVATVDGTIVIKLGPEGERR